jgi:hypothetical protein
MADPRLTPARPRSPRNISKQVTAARFVEARCSRSLKQSRRYGARPPDAEQMTQALKGERVTIYDRNGEGFAWGQLGSDGYVGWLPTARWRNLRATDAQGHRALDVCVSRTVDQAAAGRHPPDGRRLPSFARKARSPSPRAACSCRGSISTARHKGIDFVAVAERFVGTPLFGRQECIRIDCSGLVQMR